ncbi:hypothetical protein MASR1M12_28440 [Erysipelotrichia bacterium]
MGVLEDNKRYLEDFRDRSIEQKPSKETDPCKKTILHTARPDIVERIPEILRAAGGS